MFSAQCGSIIKDRGASEPECLADGSCEGRDTHRLRCDALTILTS